MLFWVNEIQKNKGTKTRIPLETSGYRIWDLWLIFFSKIDL